LSYCPSYLDLFKTGKFNEIKRNLNSRLSNCDLCNNFCYINRNNEKGNCFSGIKPIVSSYCIHFGEESVLVGDKDINTERGVGNIFFGNCNLKCVYCQNYQISQNPLNEELYESSESNLADIIIELQSKNVNSIGFVSPTHFIPQIISSLEIAIDKGFNIPLIYNTNTYDSLEVIKIIDGIIDIYLPDLKYYKNINSLLYSNAKNYFEIAKKNIIEMYNQVGSELIIEDGVLKRGMIIRHLILPNEIAGSYEILKFISELDNNITISLMAQYYPAHNANKYPLISRCIEESEYDKVLDIIDKFGLENGYIQEFESNKYYQPNFFNRNNPFTN